MILLNPGPVNVSERVRQALLKNRTSAIVSQIQRLDRGHPDKLIRAFAPGGNFRAHPLDRVWHGGRGGGRHLLSAPGRRILLIKNGVYSQRNLRDRHAHKMQNMDISFEWDQRVENEPVEVALRRTRRSRS